MVTVIAPASRVGDFQGGREMDVQAAWLLLVDAMESGHWRVVREQAEDLLAWIGMGESPPNISNGKVTDQFWNRQAAT